MSGSARRKRKALAREFAFASSLEKVTAKVDNDLCKSTNMSMVGTQKTGVSGNMSRPSQQAAILADRIGDEAADVVTVVEAEDTVALAAASGVIFADAFSEET